MGNFIKVAITHSISTLFKHCWSQRRIARALGIDRKTVGRHIAPDRHSEPQPGISTAGNLPPLGSKGAISTAGIPIWKSKQKCLPSTMMTDIV